MGQRDDDEAEAQGGEPGQQAFAPVGDLDDDDIARAQASRMEAPRYDFGFGDGL
ncbi:hypothetical protein D3C80_1614540 [compost metagenome]